MSIKGNNMISLYYYILDIQLIKGYFLEHFQEFTKKYFRQHLAPSISKYRSYKDSKWFSLQYSIITSLYYLKISVEKSDSPGYHTREIDLPGYHTLGRLTRWGMIPGEISSPGYDTPGRLTRRGKMPRGD